MNRNPNITSGESGRMGGKTTLKRHGKDHFRKAAGRMWEEMRKDPQVYQEFLKNRAKKIAATKAKKHPENKSPFLHSLLGIK